MLVLGDRCCLEHLAHFVREIVGRERFLKERPARVQQAPPDYVIVGKARRLQDGYRRVPLGQELTQPAPTHAWHDHVGDHEIDLAVLLLQ